MAESGAKSGMFAKVIQKRMVRTKEKVMQSLGKADQTTDDVFDEHVSNFQKQQAIATRLQKELKNYVTCAKAMSVASKSLCDCVLEMYEEDWVDNTQVIQAIEALNILWEDYTSNLTDQVQTPLTTYINRFPDVRAKVSKRGRKLVDFDSARHYIDSVRGSKKKDDHKIAKAQEELEETKRIYDILNNELRDELPALYDHRKHFAASHLNSLYSIEAKYQDESAKAKVTLIDISEKLLQECGPTVFTTKTGAISEDEDGGKSRSNFYQITVPNNLDDSGTESPKYSREQSRISGEASPRDLRKENGLGAANGEVSSSENLPTVETPTEEDSYEPVSVGAYEPVSVGAQENKEETNGVSGEQEEAEAKELHPEPGEPQSDKELHPEPGEPQSDKELHPEPGEPQSDKLSLLKKEGESQSDPATATTVDSAARQVQPDNVYAAAADTDDIYTVPGSNEPINPNALPNGVLYQMEAIHPYVGEDTDEVSFEIGETIDVIAFEDPEDQDEGWLMGVIRTSQQKGVFPANFCKRI